MVREHSLQNFNLLKPENVSWANVKSISVIIPCALEIQMYLLFGVQWPVQVINRFDCVVQIFQVFSNFF